MISDAAAPPQIRLTRPQWIRLVVVGIFVVLALARVVPDFVRFVYPLQVFRYVTDDDGIVIAAAPRPVRTAVPRPTHAAHAKPKPTPEPVDFVLRGDRVRVDQIKPFDRKPGLAGRGYTYDNTDRHLPVVRAGKLRVLHLVSRAESVRERTLDLLRIFLLIIAIGLGAILFLVKPSIATASFFIFCLGAIDAPTTYADLVLPRWFNPVPEWLATDLHGLVRASWQFPARPISEWFGDTLHGMVRPALLLFALCLIDGDADAPRERVFAWFTAAIGLALGALNAYADSLVNVRRPARGAHRAVLHGCRVRRHGADRDRVSDRVPAGAHE